ncbi:hypothetical protein ACFFRR_004079 [Megaselia abdita]
MKLFLTVAAFLATLSLVASEGQTRCSIQEINLTARQTCAARCTANVDVCGGGSCEVLEGGGTGIRKCVCDEGFAPVANDALCIPKCINGCKAAGGSCDAPGVCNCADKSHYFSNGQCVTKAECNGECFGKICTATSCECAAGFFKLVDGKCVPTCQEKCDATKGLECVAPNVCACKDKTFNLNAFGECKKVTFASTTPLVTTAAPTTPAPTTGAPTTASPTTATPTTEAPTTGSSTTPVVTPEVTTPAVVTPAPACDVCARLAAIEQTNELILQKIQQNNEI